MLKKFTINSLRHNFIFLGGLSFLLILFAISLWAVNRVIQDEYDKKIIHFSRLIGDIRENEKFLSGIAEKSHQTNYSNKNEIINYQSRLISSDNATELFESREFSFALPFNLFLNKNELNSKNYFSLGIRFSNYYSSFWSLSNYPPPQIVWASSDTEFGVFIPAIGQIYNNQRISQRTYLSLVEEAKINLEAQKNHPGNVKWFKSNGLKNFTGNRLVAFIKINKGKFSGNENYISGFALSIVDIDEVNDFLNFLEKPIFDSLTLISPDGVYLDNNGIEGEKYEDGFNLLKQGILFKISAPVHAGWQGLYLLSYSSFFRYAKWHIISGFAVFSLIILLAWIFSRWYSKNVVAPAKKAHSELIESDSFSRVIIQTAPVALCVLRDHSGKIVVLNHLADLWLGGADQIEALSKEWKIFISKQEKEEEILNINEKFLYASFSRARYKGDQVILCAFNDITPLKNAERVLEESKKSADIANEAKSLFLATMSHEIRTPMYGVLGTLELLSLTKLTTQQRNYLSTVQQSSSILLQLISDILDISKIEAGQMAIDLVDFNPIELVEDAVSGYSAIAAEKNLEIYACIDVKTPRIVRGDHVRIRQVINNLLSNAVKFTDFGRVVLRLKLLDINANCARLQWQVTDTGIGISQEQQLRLFEPFYQADNQNHTVSGTGLGLSISSRLCEIMGGKLSVISESGLGSSFSFFLDLPIPSLELIEEDSKRLNSEIVYLRSPFKELSNQLADWINYWGGNPVVVDCISADAHENAVLLDVLNNCDKDLSWTGARVCAISNSSLSLQRKTDGSWMVSVHRLNDILQAIQLSQNIDNRKEVFLKQDKYESLGFKVLIAEDNPINQLLIKEQLENLGCSVFLAENGEIAFKNWKPKNFDVLITDVNMPVMNGYELVKKIRAVDSEFPIIGVTANALKEEGERCIAVGMNAWLVKPMSLKQLRDILVKICGVNTESKAQQIIHDDRYVDNCFFNMSEKMRDIFIKTMREDIDAIEKAINENDVISIQKNVHRIRGAFSVVYADSLSEECAQIELQISTGSDGHLIMDGVKKLIINIENFLLQI
ncbi:response regulator [Comamonas nitrativorans]|uniref:histidine kinase n=1 Tax=Comamonas nitrativorans TaxID=108437 RepID=A0ABV9GT41_9BURK